MPDLTPQHPRRLRRISDRVFIFCGLAIFVALFTYPLWRAIAFGSVTKAPGLQVSATAKQCVADRQYMRASHMQLLMKWRENVVHRGARQYRAANGQVYVASLATCTTECHTKQQFCDRCHAYSGVSQPYCWDCHVDARSAQ